MLVRASATARASPSIGAYLDSAEWVKRLPTRVIFHPDGPEWLGTWAGAVFLEEPKANTSLGPVSCKACGLGLVKYSYPLFDFLGNDGLRFLKETVEVLIPSEGCARLEEVSEG